MFIIWKLSCQGAVLRKDLQAFLSIKWWIKYLSFINFQMKKQEYELNKILSDIFCGMRWSYSFKKTKIYSDLKEKFSFFFLFQSEPLENSIAISADSSVFSIKYWLNNNWNDKLNLEKCKRSITVILHAWKFDILAQ